MAVTVTAVNTGVYTKSWDVVASADADTTATITHGFGVAPVNVALVPLDDSFYTSKWVVNSISGTSIDLVKSTATGSGNAAAQVRVIATLPHSLVK